MKKNTIAITIVGFLIAALLISCTKTEKITNTTTITETDTLTVMHTDTLILTQVDTVIVHDTVFVPRPEFDITVGNEYQPVVSYYLNNFTDLSYQINLTHIWVHVWDPTRDFQNEWDDYRSVNLGAFAQNQFVSSGIFPTGVYRIEMRATFLRDGRSIDYYTTWEL